MGFRNAFFIITLVIGTMLNGCKTIPYTPEGNQTTANCDTIEFRATVVSIESLVNYEGSAYVTHFHPLFVLTLNIESIKQPNCQIETGHTAFAVHSPTHVFINCQRTSDSDSVLRPELWGKTFDFITGHNENQWRRLRAMDIERQPNKKMHGSANSGAP